MPNSLKCKLKHLFHNGTFTERERDGLLKALEHEDVLDEIRAEVDRQQKWLLQAGYTAYNVDIALDAIKSVVVESEDKE